MKELVKADILRQLGNLEEKIKSDTQENLKKINKIKESFRNL